MGVMLASRHGPIMLANFSQRFVLSDFGVKFIRDSRGNFKLQGATFFTLNLHLLSSYWHFYGMFLRYYGAQSGHAY